MAAAACFSHIGTAHDCSERRDTSKNVLVPKSAKQMVLEQALCGQSGRGGLCTPAPLEMSTSRQKGVRCSEALAVLSLLCLWPFGNSLTETVHSEFYQCHTQNRSHTLQPADPAGPSCPLLVASTPSRDSNPTPTSNAVTHSSATLLTHAQSDLQGEKNNRRKTDFLDLQRLTSLYHHANNPSIFLPRSASSRRVYLGRSYQTSPSAEWAVTRTSGMLLMASEPRDQQLHSTSPEGRTLKCPGWAPLLLDQGQDGDRRLLQIRR